MSSRIEIRVADGPNQQRKAPADASMLLSDWLEAEQLPLNTRCAGRGLCRGCQVIANGETLRACQTPCHAIHTVEIPAASQRDNRLNGVSSFEIGQQGNAPQPRPGIGVAIDVGTTTVAIALWDLSTGQCLGNGAVANEQRRFGDNVLSRIDHAIEQGGSCPKLQSALVQETIEPLLAQLCEGADIPESALTEGVAAGNTAMLHTLACASLQGFAAYPFQPVFLDEQIIPSSSLGFRTNFPLKLASNLGPFVGADIALGALASGLLEQQAPALLIDFGTNGEILLKTPDGFLATATAAGPAFEGGRLTCGAAAGPGVISSLERKDGNWQANLMPSPNPTPVTGISGAAYIDFLSLARSSNLLNVMGRFENDQVEVQSSEENGETVRCVRIHRQLAITEKDVAELIQAKAAISAGVMTLLEEANLEAEDLETVYIAGGFGYHLNCAHAMAVGMMPHVDSSKLLVIGNASLGGASLLLQCQTAPSLDALTKQCRVVELNQINSFEDHYIDCMPLRPIE